MKNIEIIKLSEGTKIRIKSHVDCAPEYKKVCLLSFYNSARRGVTAVNTDTGEIDIIYPFGIETPTGVCYEFPADCYELV